jgi:hypothetical protein
VHGTSVLASSSCTRNALLADWWRVPGETKRFTSAVGRAKGKRELVDLFVWDTIIGAWHSRWKVQWTMNFNPFARGFGFS